MKENYLKTATVYATYLLIVWGLYRFLIQLPDEVEELVVKPIIWLIPVFVIIKKEGLGLDSLGITVKNLFPSVYFSLALGSFFVMEALIINFIKHNGLSFAANIGDKTLPMALGISFATAVSEEIAFRGYMFNRLWLALKNEWLANVITTLVWVLIHVPIYIFVLQLGASATMVNLLITALFGLGSAFVFARTKNVFSSIFLHVLWEWPIILFR
ncbi:CPBP family intramembrane metalloprotease [Patescibacteria group bacterium]|nr:CPBP family intramembrane metalloprotease [Patescibacteria group bacterium]